MGKIEVKKLEDTELELIIHDEDHTIGNLIVKLAEDKPGVTYVAYRIEHPLIPRLIVTLMTDGSVKALDVLKETLREIRNLSRQFREEFIRAFSEYEGKKA